MSGYIYLLAKQRKIENRNRFYVFHNRLMLQQIVSECTEYTHMQEQKLEVEEVSTFFVLNF